MRRTTAIQLSKPRTDWGGSYMDSRTYAKLFQREHASTNFGVMDAQTFSVQLGTDQVNKPFMWMTQGMGNTMALRAGTDTYTWQLKSDGISRAVITDVDPNLGTQPGKAGTTFRVCLDRPNYHEPVILKTESRDLPGLQIIGQPVEESVGKYWYTVKLQTGQADIWMDVAYLQVGKTIIDGGTMVSSEMNTKYAGLEFGSTSNLGGHTGYMARRFEFTDRTIRLEIGDREKGRTPNTEYSIGGKSFGSAVSTGWIVGPNYGPMSESNKNDFIKAGSFIPTAEMLLRDRLYQDCEYMMTFGKTQVTQDADSGYDIKVAPGWLEMSRDGFYFEHNNDLTLADFTEQLNSVYFNSVNMSDRTVYIRTGQVGMKIFSRLVELELGGLGLTLSDSYVVNRANHNNLPNEFKFGAFQFTEFTGYNGLKLVVLYDPSKDNPLWYPEIDPDTGAPIESGSFDIFDLGRSEASPESVSTRSNMAYIHEPEADEYYWVSDVYDPITGSKKSGERVSSNNKEIGCYMAKSGSLEIFDISRCMRIAAR